MLILVKHKPIEKKWEDVKFHYEAAYHVRFQTQPIDEVIEYLWLNLQKLHSSFIEHENKLHTRDF